MRIVARWIHLFWIEELLFDNWISNVEDLAVEAPELSILSDREALVYISDTSEGRINRDLNDLPDVALFLSLLDHYLGEAQNLVERLLRHGCTAHVECPSRDQNHLDAQLFHLPLALITLLRHCWLWLRPQQEGIGFASDSDRLDMLPSNGNRIKDPIESIIETVKYRGPIKN